MPLQAGVHLNGSGRGSHALWLSQVLFPEEELPIQIRVLNMIRVSDYDAALSGGKLEHCKVFEELAADGS